MRKDILYVFRSKEINKILTWMKIYILIDAVFTKIAIALEKKAVECKRVGMVVDLEVPHVHVHLIL
jgi:hypothetical protein